MTDRNEARARYDKMMAGVEARGRAARVAGVALEACPYRDHRTARGHVTYSRAYRNAWRKGWRDAEREATTDPGALQRAIRSLASTSIPEGTD